MYRTRRSDSTATPDFFADFTSLATRVGARSRKRGSRKPRQVIRLIAKKNNDGSVSNFVVRIPLGGGKYRDKTTGTKDPEHAERIRAQYELAYRRANPVAITATPLRATLESFFEKREAEARSQSLRSDQSTLRALFGPITPALELRQRARGSVNHDAPTMLAVENIEGITSDLVRRFLLQRKKEGKSPVTLNHYREMLHRFIEFARKYHGYQSPEPDAVNPIAKVERETVRTGLPRYLTPEQVHRQLEILSPYPRMRFAVALMVLAGLRREEVFWLYVQDFNLRTKKVNVYAKTCMETGERWSPKDGSDRNVDISPSLLVEYERYMQHSPPPDDVPWLIPSQMLKRTNPNNWAAELRTINRAHGLRWSALDFRHTFGSCLAQKGYTSDEISRWMGNSPGICAKHYINLLRPGHVPDLEFLGLSKWR